MEISVPEAGIPVPPEGEQACRAALKDMLPAFGDRQFVETRVCWYTDNVRFSFF
jgi:sarcosine oxidase/L-pipecolate oxidase